jgi:hypothetical protein
MIVLINTISKNWEFDRLAQVWLIYGSTALYAKALNPVMHSRPCVTQSRPGEHSPTVPYFGLA